MMGLWKKSLTFRRMIVMSLTFCLIFGMLGEVPAVQAADDGFGDEVSYDFTKLGIDGEPGEPVGWELDGPPSTTVPRVVPASYGVQLQTNPTNQYASRSFKLPVAEPGTYKVKFRGYNSTGGGLSEIIINDELIGHYDYYSTDRGDGPAIEMDQKINLTAGSHQLTLKTISDSIYTPYMYPSELILVPVEPEFAFIDVEGPRWLSLGEVGQLNVMGLLSNMEPMSLEDADIQYESSDENVVQVNDTGELTAIALGEAEITTTVLFHGTVKEHVHLISVVPEDGNVVVKEFSYDFRNVGLDGEAGSPEGWILEGKPSTEIPRVIKASYGLSLQTNPTHAQNNQRSFQLPVEEPGTYKVKFRGYHSPGGELSELLVNNQFIGHYNYYNTERGDGPFVEMEQKINLTSGTHLLTLKTISDSIYTPYMYPTELVLLQMLPELAEVSVTAPSVIPIDETVILNISAILSNMESANLDEAEIQFESSDESVLRVNENGEVTSLASGTAEITTRVTLHGVSQEHVLPFTVIEGNLTGLEINVDDVSMNVGQQMYVTVSGVSGTGESIGLDSNLIQLEISEPSVASINNLGVLTAHEVGETVITAKMMFAGDEISAQQRIEVTERIIVPQEIPVATDKWGVLQSTSKSIELDGILQDEAWGNVLPLTQFVTIYDNVPAELQTEVKAVYDMDHLYFGLKGDLPSGTNETQSEALELFLRLPGQIEEFYILSLQIDGSKPIYPSHSGEQIEPNDYEFKVDKQDQHWTAEISIPLQSLIRLEVTPGEEWEFNLIRHQLHTAPVSSWFPLKTSSFWDVTGGEHAGKMSFHTNLNSEGRYGRLYTEIINPELHASQKSIKTWYPDELTLWYTDFSSKRIVIPSSEADLADSNLQLTLRTPSGASYPLESFSSVEQDGQTSIDFSHPTLSEDGSYQLEIIIDSSLEQDVKMAVVHFDREDVIGAGDQTMNDLEQLTLPSEAVELTPPSAEVQRLLDLIPDQLGIVWAGLPDQPNMRPYQLFDWDPEKPDQITSVHSDLTFPNELYPEDQVVTAINAKGEVVEYPYYEDAEGKRYFHTAHIWYKKRQYVLSQIGALAANDPSGAARVLHKFADVYEGYVPIYDHTWNNRPLNIDAGPPYPYYGGMWDWWFFMDLGQVNKLSYAYSLIKDTNVFEKLSQQTGENVREKIVEGMFLPSVEFIRTYSNRRTNMDFHIWRGLVEMGKAIDRPDLVHEGMERLAAFVANEYFFDGFYKEITYSYHAQSINGNNAVIGLLNGWTDPEGFVSQRTGTRLENLDMGSQYPILQKSQDLMRHLTYPDGKYLPIQDTWAWGQRNPDPNAGTLLMPASGIGRMAKGQGTDQSQLYMSFTSKFGHNHYDPLNLTLYSQGQELLPDLGYTYTKYRQWTSSTMGHNTVVVDAQNMKLDEESQVGGRLGSFIEVDETLQIMEASQDNAYSNVDEYSRQPWFIGFEDGLDNEGYVIDIFRVSGGNRHEYTLHGDANRDALFETDLTLTDYGPYLLPEGTEVVLPEESTDQGSAEDEYYGYIYLRDVQQGELAGDKYSLNLKTSEGGEERSGLQITGLLEPGHNELFLARSPSIRNTRVSNIDTNDRADEFTMPKYVLRREGTDLKSTFVTALEPYAAGSNATIQQIERMKLDQGQIGDVAVSVTYGNTTDIILSSTQETDQALVVGDIELHGKMGFIRLVDGVVTKMNLIDGTKLKYGEFEAGGEGVITGDITDVYRQAEGDPYNAFVTEANVPDKVQGQYMIVNHPDGKSHGYQIRNVFSQNGKTIIEIEDEPGFVIYPDGSSQLQFFPATRWTGTHAFRIGNIEHSFSRVFSAAGLMGLFEHLEAEGEISDEAALRALRMHVTAVELFEKQAAHDKVAQHLTALKMLLSQQLEHDRISADAFNALNDYTDSILQQLNEE